MRFSASRTDIYGLRGERKNDGYDRINKRIDRLTAGRHDR